MAHDTKVIELPDGRVLEVLGSVQRMEYAPGDVLVVMVPFGLTSAQREMLRQSLEAFFKGAKVLVMDGGASIGVLARQAVQEVAHGTH